MGAVGGIKASPDTAAEGAWWKLDLRFDREVSPPVGYHGKGVGLSRVRASLHLAAGDLPVAGLGDPRRQSAGVRRAREVIPEQEVSPTDKDRDGCRQRV